MCGLGPNSYEIPLQLIQGVMWLQGMVSSKMHVIRVLTNSTGDQQAEIVSRANGTFGFRVRAWDWRERSWVIPGRYSEAVLDSPERASAEAYARVEGLAERGSETASAWDARTTNPRVVPADRAPPSVLALVRVLAERLLDGPTDVHRAQRNQLRQVEIDAVEFTGAGLFAELRVPAERSPVDPANLTGGEVELRVGGLDAPAGSLIKVVDGYLRFLEIYTYGSVPWPDIPRDITFGTALPLPIGAPAT